MPHYRKGVPRFVYVAENKHLGFCKVGSTYDVKARDSELKKTYKTLIVFYLWAGDGPRLERLMHATLKPKRVKVMPIQLPGRKPVKPSSECYRIGAADIINLLPVIANVHGIPVAEREP